MLVFKAKDKYERLFVFCLLFSFFTHALAIFCLNKHLLSFSSAKNYFSPLEKITPSQSLKKTSENDILSFKIDKSGRKSYVAKSPAGTKSIVRAEEGIKESSLKIEVVKKNEKISSKFIYSPKSSFKKELIVDPKKNNFSLQLQKTDNTNKIVQSLKTSITEVKQKAPQGIFTSAKIAAQKEISPREFFLLEPTPILTLSKLPKKSSLIDESKLKVTLLKQWKLNPEAKGEFIKAPFLPYSPHIPSLADLNTIKCSDDFDVELEYIEKEDEPGYIFALTLIPKPSYFLKKLRQNFYFVIDRSNSILNKRFLLTRSAVGSALSSLNKEDTFNIFTFDSKLDFVFAKNQHPTHDMIIEGKNFLKNQNIGNFFTSKSFFLPLNKMLNNSIKKDEINNIILITDGDEVDKIKNYRLLQKWTEINCGMQSFYVVGLNEDKNLPILDFFTSLNKGQVVVASNARNIRRHLVKLIKSLGSPVAKNVFVTPYDQNMANMAFFNDSTGQNPLYLDSPYVIIGSVDRLDDFCIFLQGKNSDKWFNIKKDLSFQRAKKGGESLQKKWAIYKTNKLYENYLKDNDISHIKKAEEILKPFDIPVAFK